MRVPWENQDQEDEHSCFSDNTHEDFLANEEGIRAVYLGSNGKNGLSVLVKAKDAALDAEIRAALDAADVAVKAIPAPFDQAILGDLSAPGRVKVKAAIDALKAQTAALAKAAPALGLRIGTLE
jgi:putative iron-regulated protein